MTRLEQGMVFLRRVRLGALLLVLVSCRTAHEAREEASPPPTSAPTSPMLRALEAPPECPADVVLQAPPVLPHNVILIIGDGMGLEQTMAGRQLAGGALAMDGLDELAWLNTDSTDTDLDGVTPTDSAASATAMAAGVRVQNLRVGLDDMDMPLQSIADLAQLEGKATGLVTNSFIYDATPMAFAVHEADRGSYPSIVEQLLNRQPIDILMGGAAGLLDDIWTDWRDRAEALGYRLVFDVEQMEAVPAEDETLVLGLYGPQPVAKARDYVWYTTPTVERTESTPDPSLAAMTRRALEVLGNDEQGFFLLVESENPDVLGHIAGTDAVLAAEQIAGEVVYLDGAVATAVDWVEENSDWDQTLLVVTADHECGGYRSDEGGEPDQGVYEHGGHTRSPVEIFASGPGSDQLQRMCRISDLFALVTGRVGEL